MLKKLSKIKVTVDKSHLLTLGEKMYRESIEFVRELVNNAYDADATEVQVFITGNKIIIQDDGNGMNEKGLGQYFTIGSEEKKIKSVSPRYRRKRIGQFGIGKFSALALAEQFIVESVKGKYKYSVIFDRTDWQSQEHWDLPIRKEKVSPLDHEGTRIILNRLNKKITISEAEKYLKESVPLRAKKFAVFLNNKKVTAKTVPGRIIPINIKTMYGPVEGEIIVAVNPRDVNAPGVECRVKQVLIKRSLFGLDRKHAQGFSRITGSVNADFLPLIATRTEFITDSREYILFYQLIKTELDKVLKEIKRAKDTKNLKKINKELQGIMKRVREALTLNPDFVPQGRAITRLKKEGKNKIAAGIALSPGPSPVAGAAGGGNESKNTEENKKDKSKEEKEEKSPIDVKPLAIKRIRMNKLGISCGIVSLGATGPEVVSQGNAVYINQDHPLYQKLYKKHDQLTLHLLRIITQEIVLMKKLKITAREAFNWQSKLIKDALCGENT